MNTMRFSNQAIVGLIIVVLGVVLLLSTTGIADAGSVFRWIPSLFILLGLWQLVSSGFRHIFGPVLIIVVAAFVQLILLGVGIGNLWPVLLILLGIAILFGGSRFRRVRRERTSGEHINVWGTLGSAQRHVTSQSFKGGEATAIMGGVELDMRDATVVDKPAVLEATVIMGGLEIRVPSGWAIQIDTLTLMGGTEDKRTHIGPTSGGPPDLLITGTVLMGGLEIKD